MMRPLYRDKQVEELKAEGNRGLFWNKFFAQWEEGFREICKPVPDYPGGKQAWIGLFREDLSEEALEDSRDKARNLQEFVTNTLDGCSRMFVTTAPFVTGMGLAHPVENGFLWHHTLGVPYLPGSSVKGLVRTWMEHWLEADRETLHCLFGKETQPGQEGCVGNLIFFDAFPVGNVNLIAEVMTPHDGGWRQKEAPAPSDWHSPVPIPFLAIAPGAKFQFCIAPRPGGDATEEDAETVMNCLEEALQWLGAGAKTAVGFGRFEDEETWKRRIEEAARKKEKERAAREEAERNWRPSPGETVYWKEADEDVVIEKVDGDTAYFHFLDDADETDEAPLSHLLRKS